MPLGGHFYTAANNLMEHKLKLIVLLTGDNIHQANSLKIDEDQVIEVIY